ncbi:MAG: hypothetical protein R3291_03015, partial [Thermoplasmata archaeon]|nr:hypothetical protein [Thermoplasmata archaeon]
MRRVLVVIIAIVLAVVLVLVTLSLLRPGAPPEGPVALTFVVDVPAETPPEDGVFLELEGVAFAMNRSAPDRWTITRTFDLGETVPYRYNRNGLGYVSAEAFTPDSPQTWRTLTTTPALTTQQDVVERWRWIPDPPLSGFDLRAPPSSFPARSDGGPFLTGVDLLDFYRPEFDPLVDSTMQRVRDLEARWVHLVIIYAVVEANPPRLGDAGITMSEEAFRAHVTEARTLGLNVSVTIATEESFFPAVRTEISASLSQAWFDVYFAELDGVYQQWFPVLSELGVEMVFVPGSGLYPESPTLAPYVDGKLRDQVAFIRSNYAGLLTSDWVMGPPFTFYADLDFVGTKWDSLVNPAYATSDDYAVWLDFWAEEELDALFREYGKPVIVGVSWASYEGAAQLRYGGDDPEISEYEPFTGAVPRDLQLQADLFGATLEVLAKRPWIKGTFLFGYRYWTSVDLSPGVRGKPAEDLFRQWYGALNRPGAGGSVPSFQDVTFTARVPANTPPADQVYWVRTTFFEP